MLTRLMVARHRGVCERIKHDKQATNQEATHRVSPSNIPVSTEGDFLPLIESAPAAWNADVAVFGPEDKKLERGTDVPNLLDLYSAHRFFQIRIVRRQALLEIAAGLKELLPSTR